MHVVRIDQDGAWRNKEVHAILGDMQIILDLHPGEAPSRVGHGKHHHRHRESYNDADCFGATRSEIHKSVVCTSVGTQKYGTRERFLACSVGAWTFAEMGSIVLRQRQRDS